MSTFVSAAITSIVRTYLSQYSHEATIFLRVRLLWIGQNVRTCRIIVIVIDSEEAVLNYSIRRLRIIPVRFVLITVMAPIEYGME